MSSTSSIEPATETVTLGPLPGELHRLRQRARGGIWVEAVGTVCLLLLAYAVPTLLTDRFLRLEWIFRCLLLASFAVVVVRVVQRQLVRPLAVPLSDEEMALAVERRAPALGQALISSLQFERDLRAGRTAGDESPAMKTVVVDRVRRDAAAIPFAAAIDGPRVRRFLLAAVATAALFGLWALLAPASLSIWAQRNLLLGSVDWPRYTTLSFGGMAGEVRLPQGDALTVRVVASGEPPEQVFVDYEFAGGDRGTEPMSRTGDGEFTWTLDAVLADARLRVQGGDALPIELQVRIVERPRVDDLAVRVTYPDYMEREPHVVPATEGELRLPKGARLDVSGRSQKPLEQAFLLFGSDLQVPLAVAADAASFAGTFEPVASGLLVVDVVDRDRLGAGTPPKLLLRVGDDRPPAIEFRLRGIGASITAHARIPGDLKVKDDFGLRATVAETRHAEDATSDTPTDGTAPAPAMPFAAAAASFGDALVRSALRYETTAAVDLTQWNKVADENAAANPIRPGMLFSLRFAATDNFGPGEPHTGLSETMTFRVVTREKLVEELRRRQVEQRQELQRIADEERTQALTLTEMPNPREAGDKQAQVEARLRTLARQQQTLGRRVAFVGEAYQRILWEYENNRLIEANKVRQIESVVTTPLADLAKVPFPTTSRQVEAFAGTGDEARRREAVDGYAAIQRRLQAVLAEMEQAENLAALLEELRNVIKIEDNVLDDVGRRVKERESDLFRPKEPQQPRKQ
ncbi:MAG: hypothetical protein JNL08_17320 [Planctomycetes bacterium]|nr:hypothetical protein [Planctomycetota bacterium]